MMRLLWLTDIHLEVLPEEPLADFLSLLQSQQSDGVLITEDIAQANSVIIYLKQLAESVGQVYFVLGNHDFYGGSVVEVRREVQKVCQANPQLTYLTSAGVVSLSPSTALIGHDGWGDGRLGNGLTTPVLLNDFFLIKELADRSRPMLLAEVGRLGDEAAAHLELALREALQTHQHVIALTHVPPFREATWHEGNLSNDDWLPWFSCQAAGAVLKRVMSQHQEADLTVYCGHTHSPGFCQILPNLRVHTGQAVYFRPQIQQVIPVNA